MTRALVVALALGAACGGKAPPAESVAAHTPTPGDAPAKPAAKSPASDADLALAQAALAEQYDAGKQLYTAKKCASCHGDHGEGNPKNPALIGKGALPAAAAASAKLRKGVTFETAKDVVAFVQVKMPLKQPGTLTDAEVYAVVAWILSESKASIDQPLDAATAGSVAVPR